MQVTGQYKLEIDSATAGATDLPIGPTKNPEKLNNPNPLKSSLQGKEGEKPKKPKAVMPNKNE